MDEPVVKEVLDQLNAVQVDPDRPLIISDADEVLFAFMAGFVEYLNNQKLVFDWASFALVGNIRRRDDNQPVGREEVRDHLDRFFAGHTEDMAPVPGAAAALRRLAERAQVVVLSNLPLDQLDARRRALARHDMDYPLIANIGAKGGVVAELARRAGAPAVFIDDIPRHHTSVKEAADHVWRLHFVAHPKLAALLEPAEDSHHRADDWTEAARAIEAYLDGREA